MLEERIDQIVNKVRKLLRYNTECKNILSVEPYARVQKTKTGEYIIHSIYFDDRMSGNVLYVQPTGVALYNRKKDDKAHPEIDPYTGLIQYKNYDELLKLE